MILRRTELQDSRYFRYRKSQNMFTVSYKISYFPIGNTVPNNKNTKMMKTKLYYSSSKNYHFTTWHMLVLQTCCLHHHNSGNGVFGSELLPLK